MKRMAAGLLAGLVFAGAAQADDTEWTPHDKLNGSQIGRLAETLDVGQFYAVPRLDGLRDLIFVPRQLSPQRLQNLNIFFCKVADIHPVLPQEYVDDAAKLIITGMPLYRQRSCDEQKDKPAKDPGLHIS